MAKNTDKQYYTAYVVTNNRGDSFLNTRVYTGRAEGVWSRELGDAHIFRGVKMAQSCAGNINRRNDAGFPFARVIPIQLQRSAPRR
jgi:hypothetical protein